MVTLELHEAQLFRILVSFFGKDRVVYGMSVLTLCDGELPDLGLLSEESKSWVRNYKCLFVVTDELDSPRLVLDFMPGFTGVIDADRTEKREKVKTLLNARGVHYIGISQDEFSSMQNPDSNFDFYGLLELKVEKGDISLKDF